MFLFFCTIQEFHSQEDGILAFALPVRNSLRFNRYAINPTFSLVREQNKFISFSNKTQWVQFEDAPQTYLFSYSGRFREQIGAGLALFQQDFGVLSTFGGLINFAYNVPVSGENNLTFGINTAFYSSGINDGRVVTNFPDPSLNNIPSSTILTINPGINFGTGFFDFGLSINNLVAYSLTSSKIIEENPEQSVQPHIMYTGYLDAGGFFDESKFSTLVRSEFKKDETVLSGVAMLTVPKGIWAQAGYNTKYGFSGGIGLNISKQIALEYNYEKAMGDFSSFGSSHEITVAYRFKKNYRFTYAGDDEETALFTPNKRKANIAKRQANGDSDAKFRANREANAQIKAEEKARLEAEATIKAEQEKINAEKQKETQLAEAQAKAEAEAKLTAEREVQAKLAAEREAEAERLRQEEKRRAEAKAEAEKAERLKRAKLREEQEAKAKLEAQRKAEEAARLKAEEERLKALEEAQAKAKLEAEEALANQEVDTIIANTEPVEITSVVPQANDEESKSMLNIKQLAENAKSDQDKLMAQLLEKIAVKQKDLEDLKAENDLSEQGIYQKPKAFKSVSAENAEIERLKDEIDKTIEDQEIKIIELETVYLTRRKKVKDKNDAVNEFYQKEIERLKAEQVKIKTYKKELEVNLESIKAATEIERKRRIKRAVYDNETERYEKDRGALERIKRFTDDAEGPLAEDDFDFGETQTSNIKIVKNIQHEEEGYYLVIAVHSSEEKRDEFLTKVVSLGQKDVDFFFDVKTNKYYIYHKKFNNINQAKQAIESKGKQPYDKHTSLVKIEN